MQKFHYKWTMATDHAIVSFESQMFLKAPPKMNRFSYDCNKCGFKGLRSSLRAENLSNLILPHAANINNDWSCWKELQQMQRVAHLYET